MLTTLDIASFPEEFEENGFESNQGFNIVPIDEQATTDETAAQQTEQPIKETTVVTHDNSFKIIAIVCGVLVLLGICLIIAGRLRKNKS